VLSEDEEVKMMTEVSLLDTVRPIGSSQSVYMDGEQTSWSRKTSNVGVTCQIHILSSPKSVLNY
jgi:hypothetical protein